MVSSMFDVIVIGLKGLGAAACYHLARRGAHVLGIDQHESSSAPEPAVISLLNETATEETPMRLRAYALWRDLQVEYGHRLLFETGGITFVPQDFAAHAELDRIAEKYQVGYEQLSPTRLAQRYPVFQIPDGYAAFYEPRRGFLYRELANAAHLTGALVQGASLQTTKTILRWEAMEDRALVHTSEGSFSARQLLIAGLPGSQQFPGDQSPTNATGLSLTQRVWPNRPSTFRVGEFPVWKLLRPDREEYGGLPLLAGSPGICIHGHLYNAAAERTHEQSIESWPIAHLLPDAAGPILEQTSNVVQLTRPSVRQHPDFPHVFQAAGWEDGYLALAATVAEGLALTLQSGEIPAEWERLWNPTDWSVAGERHSHGLVTRAVSPHQSPAPSFVMASQNNGR